VERIVLLDTVSPDDIDDARVKHGFRLANVVAARPGFVPAQQVLLTADRRHVLHFIEDGQLQLRYVVVSGPDEKATRRQIEEALPTVDDAALSDLLAKGDPRGLAVAALTCAEARPDALVAFDQAFIDRAERVRELALIASAYARWPALRPRVMRVAGTDPSGAIRERALLILDAWPS
jgi:hypothetical protein